MNENELDRRADERMISEGCPNNQAVKDHCASEKSERGIQELDFGKLSAGTPLPEWVPDPTELDNWWGWKR